DIFPILVYLLRYSSPILQHEDDRKRAKIFNMLGGYALYPRSCTALLRAINGIPQDAVDEIRAVPYLVDYWDGWTYTIELVANCRALALGFDNLPLDRLCSYSGVSAVLNRGTWRLKALTIKPLASTLVAQLESP